MTELIPADLWDDYCQTRLLFTVSHQRYRLIPNQIGDNPWPWSNDIKDVYVISAIHPRSKQSTVEEIPELNQRMVETLNNLNVNYRSCIGEPSQDDWPEEESFLITNVNESIINELCREFDQNAYFHWTKDFWSVKGIFAPQTHSTNWTLETLTL